MATTTDIITSRGSKSSILLSVLLIVFGLLAILSPTVTSVSVTLVIGWLILVSGMVQVVHAFQSKGIGHIAWKLLIAACYLIAGIFLLSHPFLGLAGLTLALAVFFLAQGVMDIITYLSTARRGASGWILVDGIVTLLLSWMIWNRWPAASLWTIGTLVGISMVMTGTTRLMLALAFRKLVKESGDIRFQERPAA